MAANMVLLEKITVGAAGAASVTFNNIPQTGYTDLKIVASARSTTTTGSVTIGFNGVTTNLSGRYIQGVGTGTPTSSTYTTQIANMSISSDTTSTFGNFELYIPNYTSANYKSFSVDSVTENNATTAYANLVAGLWSSTAAITSVALTGAFAQFSTFSLYGLAAVGTTPAIDPKATGGDIIQTDGTYWYHAFLSSGTFTPKVGLTCDVLVVAGGGGGGTGRWGNNNAGGGGAGGLLALTSQSVSASAQTVTIGAGGASAASGNNSVFSSSTAIGGGYGGGYGVSYNGANGGSGGGAANYAGTETGGTATSGQGNAGGATTSVTSPYSAAGGGGSGATGNNSSPGSGAGGVGLNTWSSWLSATGFSNTYLAAGGSGGYNGTASGSINSISGGGGSSGNGAGSAAVANTGAGGGGGAGGPSSGNNQLGGAGGSGLVIVRYTVA